MDSKNIKKEMELIKSTMIKFINSNNKDKFMLNHKLVNITGEAYNFKIGCLGYNKKVELNFMSSKYYKYQLFNII
jgi:hypothetical protein